MVLRGDYPYKGHFRGRALKIETFLGHEMATSVASASWAKKVETVILQYRFYPPLSSPPPLLQPPHPSPTHRYIVKIYKNLKGT